MSKKEQVNIIIDSNEAAQNEDLPEKFVLHEDVLTWQIEPLSEGDIKIENCLFERKTPSDFASSVMEGRLRDQVERMGGREEQAYILVEGDMSDFSDLDHTGIPAKSLRGMVASVIARNNIPVVFCSDQVNLADMCVRLARKNKEADPVVQSSISDNNDAPFMKRVFLSVDGIGEATADALYARFPTLGDVTNASLQGFLDIEGIGEERAKKLTEHFSTGESQSKETSEKDPRGFSYTV